MQKKISTTSQMNDIDTDLNSDLNGLMNLKTKLLTNIGEHLIKICRSIKNEIDVTNDLIILDAHALDYRNIVNSIKNHGDAYRAQQDYNLDGIEKIMLKYYDIIKGVYDGIEDGNDSKLIKQSKINELVIKLNDMYDIENDDTTGTTNTKISNLRDNNNQSEVDIDHLNIPSVQNRTSTTTIDDVFNNTANERLSGIENINKIFLQEINSTRYNVDAEEVSCPDNNNPLCDNSDIYYDLYASEINTSDYCKNIKPEDTSLFKVPDFKYDSISSLYEKNNGVRNGKKSHGRSYDGGDYDDDDGGDDDDEVSDDDVGDDDDDVSDDDVGDDDDDVSDDDDDDDDYVVKRKRNYKEDTVTRNVSTASNHVKYFDMLSKFKKHNDATFVMSLKEFNKNLYKADDAVVLKLHTAIDNNQMGNIQSVMNLIDHKNDIGSNSGLDKLITAIDNISDNDINALVSKYDMLTNQDTVVNVIDNSLAVGKKSTLKY